MTENLLLSALPGKDGEALYWWHIAGGIVRQWGCDPDPLAASGVREGEDAAEELAIVALIPSHLTAIMAHEAIEGISAKQALAAAAIAAREKSLDKDNIHIVATVGADGELVTASVARDILSAGLARLQLLDMDPDAIIPTGSLLPADADQALSADFGFDQVIRSGNVIAVDDPALREILFSGQTVAAITGDGFDAMLLAVDTDKGLDFRTGDFVKKTRRGMDGPQKNRLGWMLALLLLLSLAFPLVQFAKYHWAASAADTAALETAAAVLGPVDDPEGAEQALDQRLIAENRGNIMFPVPAAALFSVVQQASNVSISRLAYGDNGIVSATLSGVRAEDINPALIAIQDAGFVITATSRTDATGKTQADVTVRAP